MSYGFLASSNGKEPNSRAALHMFASGFCGNEPKKAFRTLYEMIKALAVAIGGRGKLGANGMNSTKIYLLTESEEFSSGFSVIPTGGNVT